jgi:hypothetical protein
MVVMIKNQWMVGL